MTRSEALEYFREELKDGKCSDTCPICNAMEWAIKALEQPGIDIVRCEDCKFYCRGECVHPRWLIGGVEPGDYCSWSERRKPNE